MWEFVSVFDIDKLYTLTVYLHVLIWYIFWIGMITGEHRYLIHLCWLKVSLFDKTLKLKKWKLVVNAFLRTV